MRYAKADRMKTDILWIVFGVLIVFGLLHLQAAGSASADDVTTTTGNAACDANADLARRLVLSR